MNFKGYPLEHLPARIVAGAQGRLVRLKTSAQQRFPRWLGLPALGPYVQFYREDGLFSTQVSIFNYYSSFYPEHDVRLEYRISAFDRHGRLLGSAELQLGVGESMQCPLSQVIPAKLDEFGMFSVMAKPKTEHVQPVSALGATTCQFMTLYFPANARQQAPQIIHSHKLFQRHWLPKSQIVRESRIVEDLSARSLTEFYFLNPCPAVTQAQLHVLDATTGQTLACKPVAIAGHGVGRLALAASELPEGCELLAFRYEFDRRISHQKPIVFRHQQHGVINCNHS